eukprot:m.139517 g.139517  ORF g.139517 m.139517 type:complete len:112 (+) comp15949_c0_seq1:116-451(+)
MFHLSNMLCVGFLNTNSSLCIATLQNVDVSSTAASLQTIDTINQQRSHRRLKLSIQSCHLADNSAEIFSVLMAVDPEIIAEIDMRQCHFALPSGLDNMEDLAKQLRVRLFI